MSKKLIEKNEKYALGKYKGITLISLVITIVVLIILASVAIYLSLGNNGIFTRSKEAKEVTNKQTATEIINLKITTAQMNKYAEEQEMPTLKELSLILKDDNEIQYVTEKSKVASTEYDVPSESPNSIYTKLNKYPYEFEINGQLQLASINGVKIANEQNDGPNLQNKMSYEEHFTGEYWLDGRKIYEVTKEITVIDGESETGIILEDADNVTFDNRKSFIIYSNEFYNAINANFVGGYNFFAYDMNSKKVMVSSMGYNNAQCCITIRYTKISEKTEQN